MTKADYNKDYLKRNILYQSLYHLDHIQVFLQYNIKAKSTLIYSRICRKNHYRQGLLEARKIMHGLKINGCAICGYDEHDAALEFHHANPQDKEFCIGINAILYKPRKIANEINKCILLCANCHRVVEEKQRRRY